LGDLSPPANDNDALPEDRCCRWGFDHALDSWHLLNLGNESLQLFTLKLKVHSGLRATDVMDLVDIRISRRDNGSEIAQQTRTVFRANAEAKADH